MFYRIGGIDMLFKIETKNPFSGEIEYYAVAAENEDKARVNFSLEFPSFKVRNVYYIEGNVVKMVIE